jgi:hypothetical protein
VSEKGGLEDPRWVCGAKFGPVKARSSDWIAMDRLRSHGAGFETDQTGRSRRSDLSLLSDARQICAKSSGSDRLY